MDEFIVPKQHAAKSPEGKTEVIQHSRHIVPLKHTLYKHNNDGMQINTFRVHSPSAQLLRILPKHNYPSLLSPPLACIHITRSLTMLEHSYLQYIQYVMDSVGQTCLVTIWMAQCEYTLTLLDLSKLLRYLYFTRGISIFCPFKL